MAIIKSLVPPEQGYPHRIHRKKRKTYYGSKIERRKHIQFKKEKEQLQYDMDN